MKKLLIITLALLAAGSLHADTVGYTNSATMASGVDSTFTLNKFDASLGTLTGVYIAYWTQFEDLRVQVDNDSIAPQTGNVGFNCTLSSFSSTADTDGKINALAFQVVQNQNYTLGTNINDNVGTFDAQSGEDDYRDWNPGTLSGAENGIIGADAFSDYIGSGTYSTSITATMLTGINFAGDNVYSELNSPTSTWNGEVIYTYTPVPEPATASMMLFVGGLGFLIRRHFVA